MLRRAFSFLQYHAAKRRYDAAFGHLKAKATGAAARVDTRRYGAATKVLQATLHDALGRKPQ
jgi:hypothetical protein